jgi:NAD(P)H-dependent flavin oxidoreductase YrpB (nitropropane dioxygenase family)
MSNQRNVCAKWRHPSREFVAALQGAGIKVWEQVGSVAAAQEAVRAGIDLIIAQGSEAGDHNYGSLPTFVLVPSIVEAVRPTPVMAAGGITNGRQLAGALVLGADAVSIGTRFVAATEAFAHSEYKRRLVEAAGADTRLSSVYGPNMPHFNPIRVLDMGLAHEFAGREDSAPKDLEVQPIIGTMRLAGETVSLHRFTNFVPTPATEGQIDELPFLAGQGVGLVHQILPVAAIINSMIAEAVSAISALQVSSGGGAPQTV